MAANPSDVPATPPYFVSSANFLVHSSTIQVPKDTRQYLVNASMNYRVHH